MINILHADTVGLVTKQWTSVPMEIYNETEVFTSNPVENEVVIQAEEVVAENITSNGWIEEEITTVAQTFTPENIITSNLVENEMIIASQNTIVSNTVQEETPMVIENEIIEDEILSNTVDSTPVEAIELSGKAEIIESSLNFKIQSEKVLQFFNPLWLFVQENILLSSLFFIVLGLIFFLLFRTPSSTDIDMYDFDDEFEIPHDIKPRENSNNPILPILHENSSIITQGQYSILYGLINETFIYEKERIMLSPDITQERKDRALISLERKFNKILHFSLPKLSSNNSSHFTEGVLELLNEEFTKDILVIALKDILNINSINEENKVEIRKKLKNLVTKKEFA